MEIQASRSRARTGPTGEPIVLLDQDRRRWDQLLIRRGLAALDRAENLGGALGPYALQAAIAACHARARPPRRPTGTGSRRSTRPWRSCSPRPIVELNRAVAVAMAFGPAAGLEIVDAMAEPALAALPPAAQRPRRPAGKLGRHARRGPSSNGPPRSPATPANGDPAAESGFEPYSVTTSATTTVTLSVDPASRASFTSCRAQSRTSSIAPHGLSMASLVTTSESPSLHSRSRSPCRAGCRVRVGS